VVIILWICYRSLVRRLLCPSGITSLLSRSKQPFDIPYRSAFSRAFLRSSSRALSVRLVYRTSTITNSSSILSTSTGAGAGVVVVSFASAEARIRSGGITSLVLSASLACFWVGISSSFRDKISVIILSLPGQ
jgi:hypothetical protein